MNKLVQTKLIQTNLIWTNSIWTNKFEQTNSNKLNSNKIFSNKIFSNNFQYLTSTSRHGQNETERDEGFIGDSHSEIGQQICTWKKYFKKINK